MLSTVKYLFYKHRFKFLSLLFLLTVGWEFVKFSEPMLDPCLPMSDIALIETQIFYAKEFQEFTGVYSRYQFHHPGPIQFYWNAWMEWISPFSENVFGKHQFSNWLINKIFLTLSFVFFLISMKSIRNGWFYSLIFIFLYNTLFLSGMHELNYTIWNPANTIAPIFLFIFSFPFIKRGNIYALLLLPIVTQFAFQNHIGISIIVAPFTLFAFYKILRDKPISNKFFIAYLFYYTLISLILFSPAIYQEFNDDDGNISKLLHFVTKNGGIKKNLWKTLSFIGSLYTGVYSEQSSFMKNISGISLTVILIILGFTHVQERIWKEWKNIFWISFALTLYASLGMKGPLIEFGIWFYYPILFLSIVLTTKALHILYRIKLKPIIYKFFRIKILNSYFYILIIILFILIFPSHYFHKISTNCNQQEIAEMNKFIQDIDNRYDYIKFQLPFNETDGDQWPPLAGLINKLNQEGKQVCINAEWNFMFQRHLHCSDRENQTNINEKNRTNISINKIHNGMLGDIKTKNYPLVIHVKNYKKFLDGGGKAEEWKESWKIGTMLLIVNE